MDSRCRDRIARRMRNASAAKTARCAGTAAFTARCDHAAFTAGYHHAAITADCDHAAAIRSSAAETGSASDRHDVAAGDMG